jgi:hypothetical protein
MVCCYRFTVTDLRIYGYLLQKYGAIHSRPDVLLQIYGLVAVFLQEAFLLRIYGSEGGSLLSATDLWSSPCCYRNMVGAAAEGICYKFMVWRPRPAIRLQRLRCEAKNNTLSV